MDRKEKVQHSSALIPYSYYKCELPFGYKCVPPHWHSELELSYIIDGVASFIVEEERFTAKAGDIVIITSGEVHAIYPHDDNVLRYDTIVFSMDMLDAMGTDRTAIEYLRPLTTSNYKIKAHITKSHPHFIEIAQAAESIFKCVKENTAKYDMLLKSELLRLFFYLYHNNDIYKKKADTSQSIITVRPAIEYVAKKFSDNITVEELASLTHLSKSYFMRRFKEAVGIGAIEYIGQLRIKKACELLLEGEKNTAEIAYECGFRNLSNFNRQFKKIVGAAPREYKKAYAKDISP